MNAPLRTSPLHSSVASDVLRWAPVEGMNVPLEFGGTRPERERAASVALVDLSFQRRTGMKGPQAEAWLAGHGHVAPVGANRWVPTLQGGLIARLGLSEFLLEDAAGAPAAADFVLRELGPGLDGVYPVMRQDAKILIAGPLAGELFAQTCAVPVADVADGELIMTEMAGVGVLVISNKRARASWHQVWCDATYAPYLWHELRTISEEQGGGPVGYDSLGLL